MLIARLASIGVDYDGVHIRHTDLKSDYSHALAFFKEKPFEKLFVATDNKDVLQEFRNALGAERIVNFTDFPFEAGQPLHKSKRHGLSPERSNRDAILDLFTLAFSQHLFMCPSIDNPFGPYSGFSMLARALNMKPELRQAFLEQPDYALHTREQISESR